MKNFLLVTLTLLSIILGTELTASKLRERTLQDDNDELRQMVKYQDSVLRKQDDALAKQVDVIRAQDSVNTRAMATLDQCSATINLLRNAIRSKPKQEY